MIRNFNRMNCRPIFTVRNALQYMAELVRGEKEHSDWFPQRPEICYTTQRSHLRTVVRIRRTKILKDAHFFMPVRPRDAWKLVPSSRMSA